MFQGGSTKKVQAVSGIVLLLVVSMLMTVYYLWLTSRDDGTDHGPVMVSRSSALSAIPEERGVYTDHEQGFVVRRSIEWDIDRQDAGTDSINIPATVFSNACGTVAIRVTEESKAAQLRQSISALRETPIQIDGVDGIMIEGTVAGGDAPLRLYLLNRGGRTYSLSGQGTCLETLVDSFEIL
ncbi:MAG: hypothetical protein PHY34_04360 [Patescibacteria group bacterium]|nr:hypothetical protein [Patescibacteria group bacterium]MDD5715377.1 hypothetical protein [Patescibacteria group bacterium]